MGRSCHVRNATMTCNQQFIVHMQFDILLMKLRLSIQQSVYHLPRNYSILSMYKPNYYLSLWEVRGEHIAPEMWCMHKKLWDYATLLPSPLLPQTRAKAHCLVTEIYVDNKFGTRLHAVQFSSSCSVQHVTY